jgi:hypothetical protein
VTKTGAKKIFKKKLRQFLWQKKYLEKNCAKKCAKFFALKKLPQIKLE